MSATPGPEGPVDVVAAVLHRAGRVLVGQRPAGAQLAGQWEFPGGKVRQDESRQAAMRRELHEELGVRLTRYGPERFVYPTSDGAFRIHFVEVEVEGEPTALEHTQLRWLAPQRLHEVELASGDRAFADRILHGGVD